VEILFVVWNLKLRFFLDFSESAVLEIIIAAKSKQKILPNSTKTLALLLSFPRRKIY